MAPALWLVIKHRGCQALVKVRHAASGSVRPLRSTFICINLVSQATCDSVPLIRDCLAIVQELGALFSASIATSEHRSVKFLKMRAITPKED